MSKRPLFRRTLTSIIFALAAVPASAWQGSGMVTILATDPSTPNVVYAASCDGTGVSKSQDGGVTWTRLGLIGTPVFELAVDPQTPTTLYAAAGGWDCTGNLINPADGGVYKSTDGGATWSLIGLVRIHVSALAIDPKTPTILYAAAEWAGVFKSSDGGATWTQTPSGPFMTLSLAIDPVTPDIVYAVDGAFSDEGFTWDGGLFKSLDGGATWTTMHGAGGYIALGGHMAIDPQNPNTLYVGGYWMIDHQTSAIGIFKSTDGGATWTTGSGEPCCMVAIDPATPTTLYSWTGSGVYRSTDGGASWFAANTGLTDTLALYGASQEVWSFAITGGAPSNPPPSFYAGTSIGVFKSTDGGASWNPTGLFQHSPLASISLDPGSVAGGTPSTGYVTLAKPATAGGVTVALSSSNTSRASVPAAVTVPEGSLSATFTVSTEPNPSPWMTSVIIFAAFDGATRSSELFITPTPNVAALTSVDLSPTAVTGASSSSGTVTLTVSAPQGGAVIGLASSDAAVATVPPSVTVAAGATTATFTVSTAPVAASTAVTISGTYAGVTRSGVLTVIPPTLSSLTLDPAGITGGASSIGTVTLSGPAPAGGAGITLSSNNAAIAVVPPSVTGAAGTTSATFTVSTPACASGTVTITAASGGASRSAALTVTTTPDTVTIRAAEYRNRRVLRVEATSTISTAALSVYETASGAFIGTLTRYDGSRYRGEFTWPVNPQNITVRSSLCGLAARDVTAK